MSNRIPDEHSYECVEPAIGRELWRGVAPGATDEERTARSEHLRICDACRLSAAVAQDIASGLADGSLSLPPRAPANRRPRRRSAVLATSLTAAAASLAAMGILLVMLLPPVPVVGTGPDRSGAVEGFTRPVEGETVAAGSAHFRWHPVDGARTYGLRIEEIGGDFAWEGTATTNELELPPDVRLPLDREYRAHLTTVPRDLAASGFLNVRFRAGSPAAVLRFRAAAAPWPARGLVLLGLATGLAAVAVRLRDRREESRSVA